MAPPNGDQRMNLESRQGPLAQSMNAAVDPLLELYRTGISGMLGLPSFQDAMSADRELAQQYGAFSPERQQAFYDSPLMPMAGTIAGVGKAAGAAGDVAQGIRAYHGSPHTFDQFDMSRIGTGEGAQAYGHGLYFAEAEDVARQYRDQLSRGRATAPAFNTATDSFVPGSADWHAADMADTMRRFGLDPNTPDGMEWLDSEIAARRMGYDSADGLRAERVKELLDAGVVRDDAQGRMYEVNINANPDDFLDWDKPLSEQSQAVRDALASSHPDILNEVPGIIDGAGEFHHWSQFVRNPQDLADPNKVSGIMSILDETTGGQARAAKFGDWLMSRSGRDAYQIVTDTPSLNLGGHPLQQGGATTPDGSINYFGLGGETINQPIPPRMTEAEFSNILQRAGLPGIKYLDGASRVAGEGSSNYVVFDDKLIEILRRYGLLPPVAAGLGLAATGNNAEAGQ